MTELNARQEEFAKALFEAYDTNTPLKEEEWKDVVTDDETAYAVQDAVVKLKGKPTAGYKVSLTSKETQDMFDADSPLYGQQVAERFLQSPADVDLQMLNEPLLEVELTFRAKEDLQPSDTLRFVDWFPDLGKYNVMADCAVGGLVVYGEEHDADSVFENVDDAANVHAVLFKDGKKLKEGVSSEVLGNPFKSLQWLVQKLAEQGKVFTKGQMVSSGTFVLPPKLTAGKWEVEFDSGLGNVVVNAK